MAGMTKQEIHDAVWKIDDIAGPADAADHKTNPTWQPQSLLKDVDTRVRGLESQLTALIETNSALVTAVGALSSSVGNLDAQAVVTELKAAIAAIKFHMG